MNIRKLIKRKDSLGVPVFAKGVALPRKDRYTEHYDRDYVLTSMLYDSNLLFTDYVMFREMPTFGLSSMTLDLDNEAVKYEHNEENGNRRAYINRIFRIREDPPLIDEETMNEVPTLKSTLINWTEGRHIMSPELKDAYVVVNYCMDNSYDDLFTMVESILSENPVKTYRGLNDAIIYHCNTRIGVMKVTLVLKDSASHKPKIPDIEDFSASMNLAHRLEHTCIRDEKQIIDWVPEGLDVRLRTPDYSLFLAHGSMSLFRLNDNYENNFPKKKCISGFINSEGILCFEHDMQVETNYGTANVSKGCYFITSTSRPWKHLHLVGYERMIGALKAPVSRKASRVSGLTSIKDIQDTSTGNLLNKSRKITKVVTKDIHEPIDKRRKSNRLR